jgi:hypothetical protein
MPPHPEEGWQQVRHNKKMELPGSRVPQSPRRPRKVLADPIGLCFNYFSSRHVGRAALICHHVFATVSRVTKLSTARGRGSWLVTSGVVGGIGHAP